MSKRPKPKYIVVPTALIDDPRLSDDSPIFRRYCGLLEQAWVETGSQYAYVDASNAELAERWHISVSSARASLAEMKNLQWVTVEQIERVRRIRLQLAWRGRGKDRATEINAPSTRAAHLEAQMTATRTPMHSPGGDGATSTRRHLPNAAVKEQQQQQKEQPPSEVARKKFCALFADLGIDDLSWDALSKLPHVTEAYLEDLIRHREENPHLGGGYYVLKIRAGSAPAETIPAQENEMENALTQTRNELAREIWNQLLDELQDQVHHAWFKRWLGPTRAFSLTGSTLRVGVPDEACRRRLEEEQPLIRRELLRIIGYPVEVEYRVEDDGSSTPKMKAG